MSIQPMQTPDGRTQYAFDIGLIVTLAEMRSNARESEIAEEVSTWVSENEGYNSHDYERMCEAIEEALSVAVLDYIETNKDVGQLNTTWR